MIFKWIKKSIIFLFSFILLPINYSSTNHNSNILTLTAQKQTPKTNSNKVLSKEICYDFGFNNVEKLDFNQEIKIYCGNNDYLELSSKFLNDFFKYNTNQYEMIINGCDTQLFPNQTYKRKIIKDCFVSEQNTNKFSFVYGVGDDFFEYYFYATDLLLENAISFIDVTSENYKYPNLSFDVWYGQRISGFDNNKIPIGTIRETIPYDESKINPNNFLAFYTDIGKARVNISFPNIKIYSFNDFLILNKECSNNIMELTNSYLYDLFIINNYLPRKINFITSKKEEKYLLEINSVDFLVETFIQKIYLKYSGSIFFEFKFNGINLDFKNIRNMTNIYTITEEEILNLLNQNLVKKVSILSKNYLDNSIDIKIFFDDQKIQDLVFYDLIFENFAPRIEKINYDNNYNIEINTDICNTILIENFNLEMVKINFKNSPVGNIFIDNVINYEIKNNGLILELVLKIEINNSSFFENNKIYISNFLHCNFSNLENLIKNRFLKNNSLMIEELIEFILDKQNWNLIGNISEDITMSNASWETNGNMTTLSLDIFNRENKFLKNMKINLPYKVLEKNKIENNNNNNYNDYFIYIIFIPIIIFLFYIIIYIFKKKKKNGY